MKIVLDSRFIMEYFYSDKTEAKLKATKKLRDLIQRKEGIYYRQSLLAKLFRRFAKKSGKKKQKSGCADSFVGAIPTAFVERANGFET